MRWLSNSILASFLLVSGGVPVAKASGCPEAHDTALPVNVEVVADGEVDWYDLDVPPGGTSRVSFDSVFGRARLQVLNSTTCSQVAGCAPSCSGIVLSGGTYDLRVTHVTGPLAAYVVRIT